MRRLYVQQKIFKITDHYPIMDEDGNTVYQVDEDFQLIGKTVHVSDASGRHLFTVRRELLTFLPRFTVDFADGYDLTLQSKFSFFRNVIEVQPTGIGITIEGDFFSKNFDVLKNGRLIGRIDRKLFTIGDKFAIEVADESNEELFIAVMIAVDAIIDAQERS
ncbi:MAG: LURP-one-related family protein [Peptostreptococcaceae bacterium]|nr:LURP-one-related family protein [Peptostreptococcaceae bacterium]